VSEKNLATIASRFFQFDQDKETTKHKDTI